MVYNYLTPILRSKNDNHAVGVCVSKLPPLNYTFLCLWLTRKLKRYRISGRSMLPALRQNSEVLVDTRKKTKLSIIPGDIICVCHPRQKDLTLIKRLKKINNAGYFIVGDNVSESTDSRSFGEIPLKSYIGKVVCSLP